MRGDMTFIYLITDLSIGFSIFASLVLWGSYVFLMPQLKKTAAAVVACTLLLGALAGLQLFHYRVWETPPELFAHPLYIALLLVTPPSFYLFSRAVLVPENPLPAWAVIHYLPVVLSVLLPTDTLVILAFAIGAGYSLWFVFFVFGMRKAVARARFERFFFVLFAVQAVLIFVAAVSLPYIDVVLFHLVYANFTTIALLLITATLINFPDVVDDLKAVATSAYSKSSLKADEIDTLLRRLDGLMVEDKLYRNEALSLASLAEQLDIGANQLSELVNVHHECSFTTFVRRARIAEAKQLLLADPRASVLSIGLATGFRSQSNFYVAFREETGESPGAFRKSHS
ncbi:MAG: helix-turn-helix domain-containing protein [Pseudomonadota bacterium]